MSDLPSDVGAIFDRNPSLKNLIPDPVVINNSPLIQSVSDSLMASLNGGEGNDIYRIVFKKDSSRELMTINSGELKGLFTSTCIEKGRISDVAGLERIDINVNENIISVLLGIGLFSAIQFNFSYISQLCADIRTHQLIEEQSRFERITETIVDVFNSIPDMSLDIPMKHAYASRIVRNNDDCYELFLSQRSRLITLESSKPAVHSIGYNYYYTYQNKNGYNETYYPSTFFESDILNHPVFSVFERLVAGKICEIMLSGNYSAKNIKRHRDFLSRACQKIHDIIKNRRLSFDQFIINQEKNIKASLENHRFEDVEAIYHLKQHRTFIKNINERIYNLLDGKLKGFDFISQFSNKDEIEIFILNGNLLINNIDVSSHRDN